MFLQNGKYFFPDNLKAATCNAYTKSHNCSSRDNQLPIGFFILSNVVLADVMNKLCA